ncbi:MAG: hypothetical protein RI564_06705 [Gracilimonas sp.]|nr:hypothetical protein [Gracilimonas sp.]
MRKSISQKILFSALTLLLILGFIPIELLAQNGGFAGASTRLGYNARGLAMGNAMSAVTSEGAYTYYNPAHAALEFGAGQVDLSSGILPFDRVLQTAGAQFDLPPTAGLSFTLLRAGVNDIDGRTQSGYPTELFDISEYQLASNFGIRLSETFNAGIGLKFSLANYHQELSNAVAVGVDFGFLYEVSSHMNVAASVKDLFANYSWNSQDLYNLDQARNVVNNFPTRVIFGLAWQSEKLTVSGDFEVQAYSSETINNEMFIDNGVPTTISNTEMIRTSSTQLRFGSSWRAHERFTLRGGWNIPETTNFDSWGMSSGFSIHLPFDVFSPSIDYAFVIEPYRLSNMHVFSLRLNL